MCLCRTPSRLSPRDHDKWIQNRGAWLCGSHASKSAENKMVVRCVGEMDVGSRMELIAKRAKRMGIHGADLDDAVQEIAPNVIGFQFDSARSNGASLRTV